MVAGHPSAPPPHLLPASGVLATRLPAEIGRAERRQRPMATQRARLARMCAEPWMPSKEPDEAIAVTRDTKGRDHAYPSGRVPPACG